MPQSLYVTLMVKYKLIFDVSNLVYRSYFTYKTYIKDFDIGLAANREKLIRKIMIDYQSIKNLIGSVDNVIFCFDSSSFRRKIDPEYKGNRSGIDLSVVFSELYGLFDFKNLNTVKIEGLEADDCIALVCERFNSFPKIIISQDEDLRQLVDGYTYVLTPIVKNRTLFKHVLDSDVNDLRLDGVKNEFIVPEYILVEKFLKGCKSDNIKSFVPKGFRKKRILEVADSYVDNAVNSSGDVFGSIKKAVYENDLGGDADSILNQLKMVCLKSEFMPKDSVDTFNILTFKDHRHSDLDIQSVLSNTKYFT